MGTTSEVQNYLPPAPLPEPAFERYDGFDTLSPAQIARTVPAELDGLSHDAKTDRFQGWARRLNGEQLAAVSAGLPDLESRSEFAEAIAQHTPALERSVYTAKLNEQVVPGLGQPPSLRSSGVGRPPGAAPPGLAGLQLAFRRNPAQAAQPLLAAHAQTFGGQGRTITSSAQLTDTVAVALGMDPRPSARVTLTASADGSMQRLNTPPLQATDGGGGLDPAEQKRCAAITRALTELGGGAPQVTFMTTVHGLPDRPQLAQQALFRVEGPDGRPHLVDAQGAHYASESEYLSAPTRPQGVPIVMPQLDSQLRPMFDPTGQPLVKTVQATPGVLQSAPVQKAAGGVLALSSVAALVFPPSAIVSGPAAGAGSLLLGGQADLMAWRWGHDRPSLNPVNHPERLLDYGSLLVGATALGRGAAAAGGLSLSDETGAALNLVGDMLGGTEAAGAAAKASRGEGSVLDVGQAVLDLASGRSIGRTPSHPTPHPQALHARLAEPSIDGPAKPAEAALQPSPSVIVRPVVVVGDAPVARKPQMWEVPEADRPAMRVAYESSRRREVAGEAAYWASRPAEYADYQRFLQTLDPRNQRAIEDVNSGAISSGRPLITGRDTIVYRAMSEEFLDKDTMTVAANPNSMALVKDYGDMQPHRYFPRDEPTEKNASVAGPGLNVSLTASTLYEGGGRVTVAIRLGDLLDRGGIIHTDVSGAPAVQPLYITFEGRVPVTLVEPRRHGELREP